MGRKERREYRKNKRIVKMELTKVMANTLPRISKFSGRFADIVTYIFRLVDGSKAVTTDNIIEWSIKDLADAFGSSEMRLKELIAYIIDMDGEQITRLVSGAAMATNHEWHIVEDTDGSEDSGI